MHSICRFVNDPSSHGHPHVSASFPTSIIQDGNRDRNKNNVIDNKVCQGQAGAHAQQHEKLGKPEIVLEPYRKRFVIFPNSRILSNNFGLRTVQQVKIEKIFSKFSSCLSFRLGQILKKEVIKLQAAASLLLALFWPCKHLK